MVVFRHLDADVARHRLDWLLAGQVAKVLYVIITFSNVAILPLLSQWITTRMRPVIEYSIQNTSWLYESLSFSYYNMIIQRYLSAIDPFRVQLSLNTDCKRRFVQLLITVVLLSQFLGIWRRNHCLIHWLGGLADRILVNQRVLDSSRWLLRFLRKCDCWRGLRKRETESME